MVEILSAYTAAGFEGITELVHVLRQKLQASGLSTPLLAKFCWGIKRCVEMTATAGANLLIQKIAMFLAVLAESGLFPTSPDMRSFPQKGSCTCATKCHRFTKKKLCCHEKARTAAAQLRSSGNGGILGGACDFITGNGLSVRSALKRCTPMEVFAYPAGRAPGGATWFPDVASVV